ncbi:2,3-bisphosphoglycerate-dependent phosphoglycerate mutase [Ascoidea rubescens DSM 1968]|uniref:Phosphoglycerate mutase n=1 Tax=Ascoidea rubescens DSM 1968 TaxID=1344418 RepID=A0A1D2VLP9_9ASCO|nr:phosphoglycerate mutase [Ascoidea rubescens DSM 1968]ODV62531.1 phosphoglycerate mutase [Ascoidea rubescens DSM 1968]
MGQDRLIKHQLIIVRHGQSEWNKVNKFCGWIDVLLTKKGEEEARNAGRLINKAKLKPDLLITSKLSRSCLTGSIICKEINRLYIDVYRTWRLNERHYGKFQGEDKTKILQQVGEKKYLYYRRNINGCPPLVEKEEFEKSVDDRYKYKEDFKLTEEKEEFEAKEREGILELPRGESLKMVIERVKPFYEKIVLKEMKIGKTVLIVCHGSTVRSLIKIISEDQVSDEDIEKINIPNGIPLVYEFDKDLNRVGDYYYLDPEKAIKRAKEVERQGFENKK